MKNSKKGMKKRLLALLLCITMVLNGGISTFAEGSDSSEHKHTEACYTNVETKELVCQVPEEESHTHGDSCYTENKQLICTVQESEGHVHTDDCVGIIAEEVTGNVCHPEEGAEHTHTDDCVGIISEAVTGIVCGEEETEGHTHGDECYTVSSELTCTLPETEGHAHGDECYRVIPAGTLICTLAETESTPALPANEEPSENDGSPAEETGKKEETKQPEKTEYSAEGEEETTKVTITLADASHIPDEAVLEVDSVTLTDEEAAAIEGAAKAEGIYSENVTALDICFELEVVDEETGETTLENPQPLDGNEVNVAVALPGIEADDEVSVYHLRYETVTDENGEEKEVLKVEDMDASVNAETGAVEFKTPHFSIYVFVENADTAVAAIMEMLEDLPTVETVESELLAYAEAEDWDGYKEYYVEIGTAGKAAHDAYAALTDEQKANIENLEKLTALETIWSAEDLESAAEVAVVIAMIDQLPTYEEVAEALTKLEAEEDWEGYEKYIKALAKKAWPAYYAYEALSEEQKALVTNYERLMETSVVWSVVTLEEEACTHDANHHKASSAMPVLKDSTANPKPVKSGLEVDKKVVATGDPNEFELILEAYATGSKAAIPMDVVLVMDASGSMAQSKYYLSVDKLIPGYTYYTHDYYNEFYLDGTENPDKGRTYGYDSLYPSPVTWCDDCKAWVMEKRNTKNKITGYEIVAEADGKSEKYRFFETNMQATERSVREFLNAIIEHGNKTDTNHRVAMISYKGSDVSLYTKSADTGVKQTVSSANLSALSAKYYEGAFVSVSDKSTVLSFLDAYSNIKYPYQGKTPTHLGMAMAKDALANRPAVEGETIARQKLVVLFADGAPGNGKSIDDEWLKQSKKYAEDLKKGGTTVFTVGFYEEASSDELDRDLKISTKKVGTGEEYFEKSNKLFYEMASTNCFFPAIGATALSEAFKSIADKFASQPLEFDAATVMREEISKYFVLDCECKENHTCGLKVETAAYTGKVEIDKDKDGNPIYKYNFDDNNKVPASGVTVVIAQTTGSPTTDVINVTGFNYGSEENAVKEYKTSSGTTVYEGKKLILTVPIETRHGFWGGNNVPTNDATTAMYHPREGETTYQPTEVGLEKLTPLVYFPVPEANVPMTVNMEAQDKTIYYAGSVNANDLVKDITAGYTETGDEWVKPTTPVTVNADGTLTPKEDWMDDYATITWHSTSTKPVTPINNKDCGAYDYEVVMEAINNAEKAEVNQSNHPGVNKAGGAIAGAAAVVNTTLSQAKATGNVHILIPTITFKDSVVDLGFETNADYYNATNRVKTITWNPLYTIHGKIPVVSGTEPTFAYGYTPASQEIFLDTPVDVVVSYEGRPDVTPQELMAVTTFNWEKCKATDYHHETENINSHKGIDASYEFWIHTNDVYELPSTGGMGTYLYTLGGVVLMMGTSLMAYKKKRKEVLRSR